MSTDGSRLVWHSTDGRDDILDDNLGHGNWLYGFINDIVGFDKGIRPSVAKNNDDKHVAINTIICLLCFIRDRKIIMAVSSQMCKQSQFFVIKKFQMRHVVVSSAITAITNCMHMLAVMVFSSIHRKIVLCSFVQDSEFLFV